MPEIKIKHVVSFSSEDKVHKAENIIKPETYRKWKCATPGEKNATIVLQFEKAEKIHSIDIGNESSAFVEVLVGRSSDSLNDFQVLLVASSFMSPIESRNESHPNRVRMFGPDALSQNLKNEKWDCVQIVCTQPFNKNITYGLSFIKFHSPPENKVETPKEPESSATAVKLGAFKLKSDDEDASPPIGSWFGKRKDSASASQSPVADKAAPSYASVVLASANSPKLSPQPNALKRKHRESEKLKEPPAKKESPVTPKAKPKNHDNEQLPTTSGIKRSLNPIQKKDSNVKTTDKATKPTPFHRIMSNVVFVLSGFVNPYRAELRDKALEMGAKYKGDWDSTCTHLVCAFINTPKYVQVFHQGRIIVSKDWINDCYKKKTLLPWRNYKLRSDANQGDLDDESSDDYKPESTDGGSSEHEVTDASSSEHEVSPKKKVKKRSLKLNGLRKKDKAPGRSVKKPQEKDRSSNTMTVVEDESDTEDEEALNDYVANTDVDSDSGGNTEDEIQKIEERNKKQSLQVSANSVDVKSENEPDYPSKTDIAKLPLPELPNLFKNKHFYLYGEFFNNNKHDLERYITAYNGKVEDYMGENIKYVVTDSKWDKHFEEALAENDDLIFVKSQWIFKCHEAKKLVPYQPYIIIPDT